MARLLARLTLSDLFIERVSKFNYIGTDVYEAWTSDAVIEYKKKAGSEFMKLKEKMYKYRCELNLKVRFVKCNVYGWR